MSLICAPVEIDVYFEPPDSSDSLDQVLRAPIDEVGRHEGASPILRRRAGWPKHGASPSLRRRAGRPEPGTFQGPHSVPLATAGFGKEIGKYEGLRADNPNDRAKLDAYMREAGIPQSAANIAWCAAWLNAQLAHEGVEGSGGLSVSSFERWGKAESAAQAKRGDVMIVEGGRHIGRFTGEISPTGQYGFYSGNAGEPGERSPLPGRSQWGGVEERWVDPNGALFRGAASPAPSAKDDYIDAVMRAAKKPSAAPSPGSSISATAPAPGQPPRVSSTELGRFLDAQRLKSEGTEEIEPGAPVAPGYQEWERQAPEQFDVLTRGVAAERTPGAKPVPGLDVPQPGDAWAYPKGVVSRQGQRYREEPQDIPGGTEI